MSVRRCGARRVRKTLPLPPDDAAVIREVVEAIRQLRRLGIPYADLFAPLHDGGLEEALRRLTIRTRGEPLGEDVLEVVSPPVWGRYLLQYSTDVSRDRQRFAKRHGMGHVLAGHVREPVYLGSPGDYTLPEERSCDLFALADLVPAWQLEMARAARTGWRMMTHHVGHGIRQFTHRWPDERVRDRAQLRIALYRMECV